MLKRVTGLIAVLVFFGYANGVLAAGESKPVNVAAYKDRIKMACIGDSITEGYGCGGDGRYVTVLGRALGSKWELANLGVSGATMLKNGDKPYNKLGQYGAALAMKPDVVTIALGTNDSKPQNWKSKAEFEADYKAMIADIRKANPKVIIYCCLPVPAFPGNWGINDPVIKGEIIPRITKVARETRCNIIDLYAALEGKGQFVPDKVHPNNEGHKLIAAAVFKALTGKEMTGDAPAEKK